MGKKFLAYTLALFLMISVLHVPVISVGEKMYIRNDNFEGYNLGQIAANATVTNVSSKDGTYNFSQNTATSDYKGGWAPTATNGYEMNLVTTKGKDGKDTQAVQLYLPADKASSSVTGPLLRFNPGDTYIKLGDRYVYKSKVRFGGSAGEEGDDGYVVNGGPLNMINFHSVRFKGTEVSFTTDAAKTYPVLPSAGKWFDFMCVIDYATGDISVCIDGKFIAKSNDGFFKNGIIGNKPGWQFPYNNLNVSNAVYFDDIEIYGTNCGNLNYSLLNEEIPANDGLLIKFENPLTEFTASNIVVTDSLNNTIPIGGISFSDGAYKIAFENGLTPYSTYNVTINNLTDIIGNTLTSDSFTINTTKNMRKYIRKDNFESYNLGMIAGTGASGVMSKDGSYSFSGTVTADKKAGWAPGASNGYEVNMVTVSDKNGNNTQAVQLYRSKENSIDSKAGALLQQNPTGEVYPISGKYVYKAMIRDGGSASNVENASNYSQMYFSNLKFSGRDLNFTAGTNTNAVTNVLPTPGQWFEFMQVIDTNTGEVNVAIDGKLVLTNTIADYVTNGIRGSNPRWGPMYNRTNIANAFYIDDVEAYDEAIGKINYALTKSSFAVNEGLSIKFENPLKAFTTDKITVKDSEQNVIGVSSVNFSDGAYKVIFTNELSPYSTYNVTLSGLTDIVGNTLTSESFSFSTSKREKVYFRNDNFESYNTGIIAGTGANVNGVQSTDGTYWFKNTVTADKKAGWEPSAANGYEINLIATKDINGNDTKAVQIYMPKENSGSSVLGAVLQMNPYSEVFSVSDKYVYKAMLKNGDENTSDFYRMYFSYLIFEGTNLYFNAGTNKTPAINVLPSPGQWFEFMFIVDTKTGEVNVGINGKLVLTNVIEDYKTAGVRGSNPRWGPMYNYTNTANAFYIDNVEVYDIDSFSYKKDIIGSISAVSVRGGIGFNFSCMPSVESLSLITVTSGGITAAPRFEYDGGVCYMYFDTPLEENTTYTVDLTHVRDIFGNALEENLTFDFTTGTKGQLGITNILYLKDGLPLPNLETGDITVSVGVDNTDALPYNAEILIAQYDYESKQLVNVGIEKVKVNSGSNTFNKIINVTDAQNEIRVFIWKDLVGLIPLV